jgi:predicted RNase H-like nuclease
MRAVPVRINRIRLERRRIDEGIVGAVDLHDTRRMSKHAYFVGVDGCPHGWFAVWNQGDTLRYRAYESFVALWNEHRAAKRILVDIPIGVPSHPSQFPRKCDVEAQARLGRRSCTVFRVPIADALAEPDHARASSLSRRLTSKGISRQAHALREKINEVNSFLASSAEAQTVVAESHPELCFLWLRGSPVPIGKKNPDGLRARLVLLKREDVRLDDLYNAACGKYARSVSARDDILDACVLFLAAQRSLFEITETPAFGLHGLPMRILIPRRT